MISGRSPRFTDQRNEAGSHEESERVPLQPLLGFITFAIDLMMAQALPRFERLAAAVAFECQGRLHWCFDIRPIFFHVPSFFIPMTADQTSAAVTAILISNRCAIAKIRANYSVVRYLLAVCRGYGSNFEENHLQIRMAFPV